MKRDTERTAPRVPEIGRRPAPTVLVEHECKMRREPVPAIMHRDGTLECVSSACCRDCRDGML